MMLAKNRFFCGRHSELPLTRLGTLKERNRIHGQLAEVALRLTKTTDARHFSVGCSRLFQSALVLVVNRHAVARVVGELMTE